MGPRRQKAPLPAAIKVWKLEDIGEAIRGPQPEPLPRTLFSGLLIGLLEKGAVRASYRGATHILRRGTLILAQPDEAIAFEPIEAEGKVVRACLQCPSSVLQRVADEIADRTTAVPYFPNLVTPDRELAARFLRFQRMLESPGSRLESSSHFEEMLAAMIRRHASPPPAARAMRPERARVKRVREFLHENYADNITLDELARMVGLSAFRLNRVFRMEVGLPPHAYQMQVRMSCAKSLLAQGLSIDRVAVAVGFFDQSHFTNQFRRLYGYTPVVYQKGLPHSLTPALRKPST